MQIQDKKLYGDRDIFQLDEDGEYYAQHIGAMTGEKLHRKSDIAAELGFRDRQIDQLKSVLLDAINDLTEVHDDPSLFSNHIFDRDELRHYTEALKAS